MLNDQHRIATIGEPLEHLQQLPHVIGVEAGGGLVQNIHRPPCGAAAQLRGQLDALGLAAGEGGAGLAQLHIAQPHIPQGGQLVTDSGHGGEELPRLVHGHIQHVGDVFALVADLQRLAVIALAAADLAGNVHIRQEVHLDLQHTVAAAGLAAAALGVEGEPARSVAPGLGVRGRGEQVADQVEQVGIGGRIGSGRPADGALVDGNDLVQLLHALDGVVLAGAHLHAVQLGTQRLEQHLVDQRGFSAAADAGDTGERPQRDGHVDMLQVVLPGAADGQQPAIAPAALCRQGDGAFAAEILARQAVRVRHDLLRGAAGHHLPAQGAGAGANVNKVIGGAHCVLVVLHHDEGIAQIAETLQRGQQLVVIPLVQADGGLIQNIQHAHEAAADLGGQTDTLALAAGQGARRAGEGQIAQTHGLQKAQAGVDLLQDLGGDDLLVAGQVQMVEKGQGVVHRQGSGVVDGLAAHGDGQRLRPQALTLAGRAGTGGHQALDLLLAGIGLGLLIPALQVVADALEGLVQHTLAPGLVIVELQLFAAGAVEDNVLHLVA